MKKYIAFANNTQSGILTKEAAIKWATDQMQSKVALGYVHVCEVIETVERTVPAIQVKPFFTQLDKPVGEAEAA